MSAFMVNTNVVAKVVTAILLNLDTFDGESTCRTALLATPTDAQRAAGRVLLQPTSRTRSQECGDACRSRTVRGGLLCSQFKAMSCLLYQCHEGKVHESRLNDELNHAAGELAQRIVQDLPEYDKASWGD